MQVFNSYQELAEFAAQKDAIYASTNIVREQETDNNAARVAAWLNSDEAPVTGFPYLRGTDKQVRWGDSIRERFICAVLDSNYDLNHILKWDPNTELTPNEEAIRTQLRHENKAWHWIEQRGKTVGGIPIQ